MARTDSDDQQNPPGRPSARVVQAIGCDRFGDILCFVLGHIDASALSSRLVAAVGWPEHVQRVSQ